MNPRINPFRRVVTIVIALVLAAVAVFALSACGASGTSNTAVDANKKARQDSAKKNSEFKAPEIKNNVEYQNYYSAQKLYDSPTTIIWCTTTWGNSNAPLVTVPVTGKLTSSSVSLFPSTQAQYGGDYSHKYNPELTSVDGMFHGSPPPYRYGFTPGGQYVDFFNMPTFCTTALTKMQRQATKVTVSLDSEALAAQKKAEAALKTCTAGVTNANPQGTRSCPAAEDALAAALGGGQ